MAPATTMTSFQAVIGACRDVLRREGITGMDSMKHLTLYILARSLTRKECTRFGIPEAFAWESFMELAKDDSRRQECYDRLYNRDGTDLIAQLDSLFGTRNFNFKLKSPDNHIAILKAFEKVDLEELAKHVDVLGTVYEHHLGSGSNKSAMRDLGQFFTDRTICAYMVKLVGPRLLSSKKAESVLDPTMGTGGFLTTYAKHFKDAGLEVDWASMQNDLAGYDIDDFVMAIGRINMYLATGVVFNRIAHRDTLKDDVGEPAQRTKFKVILANEPFGVKGLKFADCCKRVKDMRLDGTKSEPLFLNLMMAALDEGGRCAVVVPDSVLTNTSKQHVATRKYLLERFALRRIVKMNGRFFTNTAIQTSILFFENTGGEAAESVEFWEAAADERGEVVEKRVLVVPRLKMEVDGEYSFDLRRYKEAEVPLNGTSGSSGSTGWPTVKLGEILVDHTVKSPVASAKSSPGSVPLFSSSCDVLSHDVAEFSGRPYLIQGSRGTISKATHYCTLPFAVSNNVFVLSAKTPEAVSLKFVYYYLKVTAIADKIATTSVIPMLTKGMFREIQMPLPPLAVQNEIVETFDRIFAPGCPAHTDTGVLARTALDVRGQMVAIMNAMENRGFEKKQLGEILKAVKGKEVLTLEKAVPGPVPLYSASVDVRSHTDAGFDGEESIIQACVGSNLVNCIHYVSKPFAATANLWVLRKKESVQEVSLKYVYYWMLLTKAVLKRVNVSVLPKINKGEFDQIQMPLPPLAVQQSVLARLDFLQSQMTALENLQTQSEDTARFILESYLQTSLT